MSVAVRGEAWQPFGKLPRTPAPAAEVAGNENGNGTPGMHRCVGGGKGGRGLAMETRLGVVKCEEKKQEEDKYTVETITGEKQRGKEEENMG